jgi:hypothetical protein
MGGAVNLATDTLIRAVASFPKGATTREIAAKLDKQPRQIGARLSQQYMYGKIDRDVVPRPKGGRIMVWRPHV